METIIADTGPLVAYLKRDDKDHPWARAAFQKFRAPLLTCDAALSEAFFLLRHTRGGVSRLVELLEKGIVVADFHLGPELRPVGQLLRKYESVPMSFADACLVRMAEVHEGAKIFTLDADFRIYRKNRRQIIPLICPRSS